MEPTQLFEYVTINTLMHILSDGIRFTQPSAFNDPFELLPEICVPVDQVERQVTISFDITAKRRTPPAGATDFSMARLILNTVHTGPRKTSAPTCPKALPFRLPNYA
jgi:hypothetical protein